MKLNHSHHTKKKRAKNHSSKAKNRKISNLGSLKVKVHTHTKGIVHQKMIENLIAIASKLPNKKYSTKKSIIDLIVHNHSGFPKKDIKLLLNKIDDLTEEEIENYKDRQIPLQALVEEVILSQ